ncbi:MAG: hypothetical protein H6672_16295 [Anaerolineaceae bacterium]|nr:hypothetical protein [Anaerolineaceae bacterium]
MSELPEKNTVRGRMLSGIAVIVFGVMLLITNFNQGDAVLTWVWIVLLAAAAAAFAWLAVVDKLKWAWLVAYICGGASLIILLSEKVNIEGQLFPAIVLLAIALPFIAGWWNKREDWGLLIPAYILLAVIPILFISENDALSERLTPAYTLVVIGVPFLVGYFIKRTTGLLVAGGILVAIGVIFLISSSPDAAENVLKFLGPIAVIGGGIVLLARAWTQNQQH